MTALVRLSGVSKHYPKVHRKRDRLIGLAASLRGVRELPSVAVLNDIDLVVERGESLAVIGENGAGKSTLLKLIAGVLHPTHGYIEVAGKVGALLELGAGFHPDYSGRRNLLMAATMMGFSLDQAHSLLPAIAAFSELEDKLDEPIKHYSSGMVVRLGFALIAHTHPDLLISDEVLAVGDEAFQRKCIAWLEQYLADGGTLLLVSHSLYHVQKLCQKACWIHAGRLREYGDVFEVGQAYLAYHEAKLAAQTEQSQPLRLIQLDGLIVNAHAADAQLKVAGQDQLMVQCTASQPARARVTVARADGAVIASADHALLKGKNQLRFDLPGLLPAQYTVELTPVDNQDQRIGNPLRRVFQVSGRSRDFGSLALTHHWGQQ